MDEGLTTFIVVVAILVVVLVVSWVWVRLLTRGQNTASRAYSCPHVGPGEFSGGCRDAALVPEKCSYQLRCTLVGLAFPRCPTHHCELTHE
jgi:hypothetical protein